MWKSHVKALGDHTIACSTLFLAIITWHLAGVAHGGACSHELGQLYAVGADYQFSCNRAPAEGRIPCNDFYMFIVETGARVPAELLQEIGSELILTQRNASQQRLTYRCMCNTRALSETCIRVDSAPLPLPRHDFNCVSHDFATMQCKFPRIRSNVPTTYTLTMRHSAAPPDPLPCMVRPHVVACNISGSVYVPTKEHFHLHLNISNPFGVVQQHFKINHYASIRPAAPGVGFRLFSQSVDSMCFTWQVPNYANYAHKGLAWQAHLTPLDFPTKDWPVVEHSDGVYCLRRLPFADYAYKLRLWVRVNVAHAPWSDSFDYAFHTEKNILDDFPDDLPVDNYV